MQYYSTNGHSDSVNLWEAVTNCFAPDGGVYMPLTIPYIPRALFNNIADMSLTDIAYVVSSVLFGSDISSDAIHRMVGDTFNFDIPLVKVGNSKYALELFHGPTGTFKDVGARFMAQVIKHLRPFSPNGNKDIYLLVATSGDTGYSVARAFADMRGVKVMIFHPSQNKSRIPAHVKFPLTSNVISVEVRGTLDDCQDLVRRAYDDEQINSRITLTSANSVNIARLLPQAVFYFYAYAQLKKSGIDTEKIVVAMPCGNLGNLTACLFARQMGLPLKRILAAGRGHSRIWGHMNHGLLDVSHTNQRALSTNLARINTLMKTYPELASNIECRTYSSDNAERTISQTYNSEGYLMGLNSAMAYRSLCDNLNDEETGIFLATDTPYLYPETIANITGQKTDFIHYSSGSQKNRTVPALSPTLPAVRNFILNNL